MTSKGIWKGVKVNLNSIDPNEDMPERNKGYDLSHAGVPCRMYPDQYLAIFSGILMLPDLSISSQPCSPGIEIPNF